MSLIYATINGSLPEGSIFGKRNYDIIKDDDGNGVTVEVDLPGLSTDDVEVTVEGGCLIIEATKETKRRNTSFRREFNIEGFDRKSVKPVLANGVLSVHIDLAKSSKPKKIKVASA
jgi:HSP20 family molecular chaperone IbpA